MVKEKYANIHAKYSADNVKRAANSAPKDGPPALYGLSMASFQALSPYSKNPSGTTRDSVLSQV
jgi:hypothetical protein